MTSPLDRPNALWLAALLLAITGTVHAGPPATPADAALEKEVRALFAANCYRCHSHQAGKSKGNLVLDSMASMRKGGVSAPAVVPGQPAQSLLYKAVLHQDDGLKMPRGGKLPDAQVALLRDWIAAGAPWTEPAAKHGLRIAGQISAADRRYWAFQPVKAAALPAVIDPACACNPIDRFIGGRLDAEGLKPSPSAERHALIRRVTFDLVGLPPTPAEVDAFVADAAPGAYERLVDRLLASPRYGEQMARHWLDLVRYADSDGFRQDAYRPNAWRYRDYVVRAFNADKRYDRFVQEQLAGDELDADDPDCAVATGFLCHGVYEYNQRDVRTQWDNMLNEVTDVTADVFLGLGFACARCHDHKYDPILQRDYYRLRAFFTPLMPAEDVPLATRAERKHFEAKHAAWLAKTAAVRAAIATAEVDEQAKATAFMLGKFPPDIQALLRMPRAQRTPLEHQLATLAYRQVQYELDHLDGRFKGDAKEKRLALYKELARFDDAKPPPLPAAPAAHDVGTAAPPTVIPRHAKEPIEPALPTVLDGGPLSIAPPPGMPSTGRRLALARWLTRPDHPLTARVLVNRVWQQHFGRGLVATPNDFGRLGAKPSHPELLDWLADRFVRDGWSVKKLHRLMVTSRTYRQSSTSQPDEAALTKDPENLLLWRQTLRRLTAEQIRDAILSVNGTLDPAMGAPGVEAKVARRSVYTKVVRNARDPLLDVFDAPETFTSTASRNTTTTPTQALLLLNAPFMQAQAQAFAAQLMAEAPNDGARIDAAFRRAFGRLPTVAQRQLAQAYLTEATLVDLCLVLLNANEFLFLD